MDDYRQADAAGCQLRLRSLPRLAGSALLPQEAAFGQPRLSAVFVKSIQTVSFFRFPILPRRPPVSAGAELAPRSLPSDTDEVVATLAKGVNELLNYAVKNNQFPATH